MKSIEHQITQIAPDTWCIDEFKLVNAFLLAGNEKAALIDTGCGIGDIAKVARSLTGKPLEVLLTHGHPDHIGGLYTLMDVPAYLHPADKAFEDQYACDNRFRYYYIESRGPVRFPGEENQTAMRALVPEPDPGPITLANTLPLTDGQELDLGDRPLEVLATPGHSDGSVCFLDVNHRILFSGDTVNNSIILMRLPDNDPALIRRYHKTLEKLWNVSDRYDCLAIGHDGITIDKQIVHDYLMLTAGILDGSIVGSYQETGFRKGDVARLGMAELWYHCDA